MEKICLSWELVNKVQQCLLQHLKSVIKNTKRPKLERFSACNFPAVLACTSLWVSSAGLFFHVHHQLVIIAILKAMPDGSLEAGMQLVYERKSCNITLHRDLSGPTQRTLLLFPTPFLTYPPQHTPLTSFPLLDNPVAGFWAQLKSLAKAWDPWEPRDTCILKQMASSSPHTSHLWKWGQHPREKQTVNSFPSSTGGGGFIWNTRTARLPFRIDLQISPTGPSVSWRWEFRSGIPSKIL